jgi:hypothetical protein
MVMVYDVEVELQAVATHVDILRLKDHFKALSIDAVGLEDRASSGPMEELSFSIYGDVGPFMMKRMVQECTRHIFPGSVVELSHRG